MLCRVLAGYQILEEEPTLSMVVRSHGKDSHHDYKQIQNQRSPLHSRTPIRCCPDEL